MTFSAQRMSGRRFGEYLFFSVAEATCSRRTLYFLRVDSAGAEHCILSDSRPQWI